MRHLKRSFWLTLLLLLTTLACGELTLTEGAPTPAATSPPAATVTPAPDDAEGLSSPRDGNGLPPTFTPVPTANTATLIPLATSGSVPASSGETYTVQAGDTLGEIAEQFGVSLADLAAVNNIQNIDIIEVGQVLIIPE